jgi:hypothetical protein
LRGNRIWVSIRAHLLSYSITTQQLTTRYGQDSIEAAIRELQRLGCIAIVPIDSVGGAGGRKPIHRQQAAARAFPPHVTAPRWRSGRGRRGRDPLTLQAIRVGFLLGLGDT